MSEPLRLEHFVSSDVSTGISSLTDSLVKLNSAFEKNAKTIRENAGVMKAALEALTASAGNYDKSVQALIAKVDLLEKENKKLTKSFKASEAALRKSKRETVAAKQRMDDLAKATKKAATESKKSAGVFSGAFKQIAGAMTAANIISGLFFRALRSLRDGLMNSVKSMAGFESQMAAVQAITGSTSEEMQSLTQDAIRLGGATIFTATQVGQLQVAYGKLGFKTDEILAATEATLNLAAATDEELGSAAAVAGATLRAFQMDASKMGQVVDTMAKSFTSSALDMEKFRESMKFLAPVARKAGFGMAETTAILAKLADTGLYGSLAGTSMRNILLKMSDASSDLSKRLGGTVTNMQEFVEAMQKMEEQNISLSEALEITDQRAVTAFATLADMGDELQEMTLILYSATDAAKEMADIRMDTLTGKVTILKSAWEGVVLAIDQSVAATSTLGRLTTIVTRGLQAFKDNITAPSQAIQADIVNRTNGTIKGIQDQSREYIAEVRRSVADELKLNKDLYKAKQKTAEEYNEKRAFELERFNSVIKNDLRERLAEYVKTTEGELAAESNAIKAKYSLYKLALKNVEDQRKALVSLSNETGISAAKNRMWYKGQLKAAEDMVEAFSNDEALLKYASAIKAISVAEDDLNEIRDKETMSQYTEIKEQEFDDWVKIEKARIAAMLDGEEKDIAARTLTYKILKQKLDEYGLSYKSAYEQLGKDIVDIKLKYLDEEQKLAFLSREDGINKELDQERVKWDAIIRTTEEGSALRIGLEEQKNNALAEIGAKYLYEQIKLAESSNKIDQDAALDRIDAINKASELEYEVKANAQIAARDFSRYTDKQNKAFLKQFEDDKTRILIEGQIERLKLELEFSKREQDNIRDNIEKIEKQLDDSTVRITAKTRANLEAQLANLKSMVADPAMIQNQIDALSSSLLTIGQNREGSDDMGFLARILGIDNKTIDEFNDFINDLEKGAKKMADILQDMADSAVDSADRRVDASNTRISQLQSDIDLEYRLMEDGKANRFALLKGELEQERKLLAEAEAEQKKALQTQQKIESAMQISSLITASADIIKSATQSAGLAWPVVAGISLTTMWGAFIASKAQAADIAGYKDGVIDLQGAGSGTSDSIPANLSAGESVMTASETNRFKPVFQAIRDKDDVKAMTSMLQVVNPDMYKKMDQTISLKHNIDSVMEKHFKTRIEGDYKIERLSGNHIRKSKIR